MQPGDCTLSTDTIQKKIILRAPLQRVWKALADSQEFGAWFGMNFEGFFTPGARVRATIVGTEVDAEVARAQKEYAGTHFEITIDRMENGRLFSFRWHPGPAERDADYSHEPTTLVVFTLEPVSNGVMLTVTESGFDQIPLERRAKAFQANAKGWGTVVQLIEKYLVEAA
ncbi:MAG: SRPBCC family protein [Acidobacteria bacterium]|nr:SRPBCC family protein [Acidobacteriota bacterium]